MVRGRAVKSASAEELPSNAIVRPYLHPTQQYVWDTQKQFNVLYAGRRWGKTDEVKSILTFGKKGLLAGYPCAYATPKSDTFDEVWLLMQEYLAPLIDRIDTAHKTIYLKNKASLKFYSLWNNRVSGRGKKFGVVVIDEAAFVDNLRAIVNKVFMPTLADFNGSMWLMSSPDGPGFMEELWQRGQDKTTWPLWKSWRFPSACNPFIPNVGAFIEEQRRSISSIEFRQEWLAETVSESGNLVNRQMIRYGTPIIHHGQKLVVSIGIDLAASQKVAADFNALVATTRIDGEIYVLEAIRVKALPTIVKDRMYKFFRKWNPTIIMIEQAGQQAYQINDLMLEGDASLPIKRVNPRELGDKFKRFLPVLAKYEHGHILHAHDIDKAFEEEVINFTGVDKSGMHDDYVDALVYSVMGLDNTQPRQLTMRVSF